MGVLGSGTRSDFLRYLESTDKCTVPATIATPLASGGLATPVWCWFAGTFFAMSIALSGTYADNIITHTARC